eukprot:scaffold142957_cov30-Tisochrysis_lutea.AAC.2
MSRLTSVCVCVCVEPVRWARSSLRADAQRGRCAKQKSTGLTECEHMSISSLSALPSTRCSLPPIYTTIT